MIEIIPSILTNDPKELEEKLNQLEGVARRVQVDIIDGVFAKNRTILPDVLAGIETTILFDFHLMTKEPIDWLERCVTGGADRVFGQIEEMSDQMEFVGKAQEVGLKVGFALELKTGVEKLDSVLLMNLDAILLMSVPAGFGGQEFDSRVLARIEKLNSVRSLYNTPFVICVDGGINEVNIKEVVKAGAHEVVVGERLWEGNMVENIKRLQEAAYA